MQGFNMGRYVPPDVEGTVTGNQLHHRPRAPATVRFEMPFATWCTTCPQPTLIGQGVRFNAEKRQTGAYHSTRIWAFRMRHADCGGTIEIRTDPKNTAYVVVSGGRKHNVPDNGSQQYYDEDDRQHAVVTDEEREQLRKDAFANLEKTIEDREQLVVATRRIDGLEDLSARQWQDPALLNSRLRSSFRQVRKQAERDANADEVLKARMGLDIELVPENEADARRAALADFGNTDDDESYSKAISSSLFPPKKPFKPKIPAKGRLPKAEADAARARQNLASEVLRNSRAANDPFLAWPSQDSGTKTDTLRPKKRKRDSSSAIGGLKIHVSGATTEPPTVKKAPLVTKTSTTNSLVDYDSDS